MTLVWHTCFLFFLGLWIGLPACIEEFDGFIQEFYKASSESEKQTVIDKAQAAAEKVSEDLKERATIYVKTFQKLLEKGNDFISTELSRVEKLSEEKVSAKKKQQLKDRASILTSFQLWMKSAHDEL